MSKQSLMPSTEKQKSSRQQRSIISGIVSVIVIAIVALALWLAVASMFEKLRLSQGLQQVIGLVDLMRGTVKIDHSLIGNSQKDLLDALEKSGHLKTDTTIDTAKALYNPWHGLLTSHINADGDMRIDTLVPPHACQQFILSFAQTPHDFGIKRLEVHGSQNTWRQLYDGIDQTIHEDTIIAGCSDPVQTTVSLVFSLE